MIVCIRWSLQSPIDVVMAISGSAPKDKYPAKAHARRVTEYLRSQGHRGDGLIYLEAQKTRMIEDNDEPVPFR